MLALLATTLCLALAEPADRTSVLVVVGAPGTPEYGAEFRRWAELWRTAAKKGGAESITIGEGETSGAEDRDTLHNTLIDKATAGREPLWVVLIGHGTFDGHDAKFNLRGPDVTAAELAEWLKPIKRPIAILNCASASGPFINVLSAEGRVVVTATRSGDEQNFARLGQYLAESIADPAADLDKDGQVSLLEAFLMAGGRTDEFYKSKARLATEHALLDDNGDRLGTPADWFRGIHATKRVKNGAAPDGARAHQLHLIRNDRERSMPPEAREHRDRLERAAADLRAKKDKLPENEYYEQLETIMVEIARLYRDSSSGHGH
ncbi:MAG: hypothetical protein P4L85_27080 [Paludisphaera borealis]|uniref:hypothetical protein n=1 Tax=Paludisphaera borealis TaxID=1387353 RepID=UPI00283DCD10|nr:hypothetical protein [Paludisphaera borealis]MDR3623046.1 hypothetical protein [Paludisphaera borealis]